MMFQAILFVCLISDPTHCLILEDQRGPYKTYERCETRAYEMSRMVHIKMRGYKPTKWNCRSLPKGALTLPNK
jgi:hypothetical protein